jgi:CBS domain-containing protein
MIIASILTVKGDEVVAVSPDDSVLSVARTLSQHRIGAALVRDQGGTVLGIISERDIVRGMAGHGPGTSLVPAAQLMTREVVTVAPQTPVTEALALMTERRIRHLPVMETDAQGGAKLAGLVSIGDLVKARIEEAEHEAQELRAYVVSG